MPRSFDPLNSLFANRYHRGDFIPLSDTPSIQKQVFGLEGVEDDDNQSGFGDSNFEQQFERGEFTSEQYFELIKSMDELGVTEQKKPAVGLKVRKEMLNSKLAPKNPMNRPERSVQLSHVTSGGRKTGKILNRYGKST